MNKEYEFCLRCGRKLKTEVNRKRGFGELCWKKIHNNHVKPLFITPNTTSITNNSGSWYFTSNETMVDYINSGGVLDESNKFKIIK